MINPKYKRACLAHDKFRRKCVKGDVFRDRHYERVLKNERYQYTVLLYWYNFARIFYDDGLPIDGDKIK